jgi:hypothetical protein
MGELPIERANEKQPRHRTVIRALIHLLRLMWHRPKMLWVIKSVRKHPPM